MADTQTFLRETLQRAADIVARRRAEVAALPCGSCSAGSESANACKYRRREECKHHLVDLAWRERAERERQRRQRLHDAGVGLDASLMPLVEGKPDASTALAAVSRCAADLEIRWLLLHGATGGGKTFAALSALVERPGLFVTAHDLSVPRPMSRQWDKPRSQREWTLAEAEAAQVLVVDDVGLERHTEFAATQIESVICSREYGKRITIITTNLEPKALAERYGARFVSRVGGAKGRIVKCDGPDRRARK